MSEAEAARPSTFVDGDQPVAARQRLASTRRPIGLRARPDQLDRELDPGDSRRLEQVTVRPVQSSNVARPSSNSPPGYFGEESQGCFRSKNSGTPMLSLFISSIWAFR